MTSPRRLGPEAAWFPERSSPEGRRTRTISFSCLDIKAILAVMADDTLRLSASALEPETTDGRAGLIVRRQLVRLLESMG